MKDGTVVDDPRLSRIYPGVASHMPSLNYLTRDLPQLQKPFRSYTWPLSVYLDQQSTSECVQFSICHELLAIPKAVNNSIVQRILSQKIIYWNAQKIDPWPGGEYPGSTPKYGGTSVQAGSDIARKLGLYGEVRWSLSVEEMALAVGYGGPVVIGVNWYGSFFSPDTLGWIRIGNSRIEGGHAILVRGVRVAKDRSGVVDYEKSYFILHNSWGQSWGLAGLCKISWADMARLISEEGEVMLPSIRLQPKNLFPLAD